MRLRFLIALVGVALSAAVAPAVAQETLRITGVRYWSLADVTRVAIEVNGDFRYTHDRLDGPPRIFFDLFGALPPGNTLTAQTTEVGDRLLKRIRVGANQPRVTRVVLDTEPGVEFTASQLSIPDRLMIELRFAGREPGAGPLAPPRPSVTGSRRILSDAEIERLTAVRRAPDRMVIQTPPLLLLSWRPVERQVPELLLSAALRVPAPPPIVRRQPVATVERSAPRAETVPALAREAGHRASAAKPTSSGQSSMVRTLGLKLGRVVLDPGHGGQDEGTRGPSGLTEKALVLDVAKRLGQLIEQRLSSEVIYTRTDDRFVSLEARTALANEKKADLFLSIHANSSSVRGVVGVETFYLNLTTAKDALDVATRENASSQLSMHELRELVQKITLNDKIEESREFAQRIQTSLQAFTVRYSPGAQDRGVKKAPFVVLIGAEMPAVLAEVGFISNPRQEALLSRPDHRQRLAEALFRGLQRYADGLSHFQVAHKD